MSEVFDETKKDTSSKKNDGTKSDEDSDKIKKAIEKQSKQENIEL